MGRFHLLVGIMGLLRSSCYYCGDTGVEEKCGNCGTKFHVDCARNAGHLQLKDESGLIRSKTKYRWNCPTCPNRSQGTV